MVALNAALVLWTSGLENNIKDGFNKCLIAIKEGLPWEKFVNLKNYLEE